jgi:hypothetical protein
MELLQETSPSNSKSCLSSQVSSAILLILLAGTGLYTYMLRSDLAQQMDRRLSLERTLRDETARMEGLKQHLTVQEQQVAELKTAFAERAADTGKLKELLSALEQEMHQLRQDLAQRELELSSLHKKRREKVRMRR